MDALERRTFFQGFLGPKTTTTKTTLYRLIEEIQKDVPPEADALVVAVVSHLSDTGRMRLPSPG